MQTLTFSPSKHPDSPYTSNLINNELFLFNNWFEANKFSFNIDKTDYIMIINPNPDTTI